MPPTAHARLAKTMTGTGYGICIRYPDYCASRVVECAVRKPGYLSRQMVQLPRVQGNSDVDIAVICGAQSVVMLRLPGHVWRLRINMLAWRLTLTHALLLADCSTFQAAQKLPCSTASQLSHLAVPVAKQRHTCMHDRHGLQQARTGQRARRSPPWSVLLLYTCAAAMFGKQPQIIWWLPATSGTSPL